MLKRHRSEVYNITQASAKTSADQDFRVKFYLVSMLIRTLCFVGAVVTTGGMRFALAAGAIFLPYLAVVVANAVKDRKTSTFLGFIAFHENALRRKEIH